MTLVDLLSNFDPAADINQQIHTVKFGIKYRFNFGKAPGGVVARYMSIVDPAELQVLR